MIHVVLFVPVVRPVHAAERVPLCDRPRVPGRRHGLFPVAAAGALDDRPPAGLQDRADRAAGPGNGRHQPRRQGRHADDGRPADSLHDRSVFGVVVPVVEPAGVDRRGHHAVHGRRRLHGRLDEAEGEEFQGPEGMAEAGAAGPVGRDRVSGDRSRAEHAPPCAGTDGAVLQGARRRGPDGSGRAGVHVPGAGRNDERGEPDGRPRRPGGRLHEFGFGGLSGAGLRGGQRGVRQLSAGAVHQRRARTGGVLRLPAGRRAGLPVVERLSGQGVHGRHGQPGAGRHDRDDRHPHQAGTDAADRGLRVRGGGRQRADPAALVQVHAHPLRRRPPRVPHGAHPPPFRNHFQGAREGGGARAGFRGELRGDPLLDRLDRVRAAGAGDAEAALSRRCAPFPRRWCAGWGRAAWPPRACCARRAPPSSPSTSATRRKDAGQRRGAFRAGVRRRAGREDAARRAIRRGGGQPRPAGGRPVSVRNPPPRHSAAGGNGTGLEPVSRPHARGDGQQRQEQRGEGAGRMPRSRGAARRAVRQLRLAGLPGRRGISRPRLAGDRSQLLPAGDVRGIPAGHRRADERAAEPSGPARHLGGLCPPEGAAVRPPARGRCRADAAGMARTLPGMVGRPRPVEDLRRGCGCGFRLRGGPDRGTGRGQASTSQGSYFNNEVLGPNAAALFGAARAAGVPPETVQAALRRFAAAAAPGPARGGIRRRALCGRFQGDQPVGHDRLDPHAGPPGLADCGRPSQGNGFFGGDPGSAGAGPGRFPDRRGGGGDGGGVERDRPVRTLRHARPGRGCRPPRGPAGRGRAAGAGLHQL